MDRNNSSQDPTQIGNLVEPEEDIINTQMDVKNKINNNNNNNNNNNSNIKRKLVEKTMPSEFFLDPPIIFLILKTKSF
jgi:hypothetical protein